MQLIVCTQPFVCCPAQQCLFHGFPMVRLSRTHVLLVPKLQPLFKWCLNNLTQPGTTNTSRLHQEIPAKNHDEVPLSIQKAPGITMNHPKSSSTSRK